MWGASCSSQWAYLYFSSVTPSCMRMPAFAKSHLTSFRTFVYKMTVQEVTPCTNNPLCILGKEHEPHLKHIRKGLIDPDTPASAMTRKSHDGSTQVLVVSQCELQQVTCAKSNGSSQTSSTPTAGPSTMATTPTFRQLTSGMAQRKTWR